MFARQAPIRQEPQTGIEKLKESYSNTGRPSIDPELLLRILLIGYLHGLTSPRADPQAFASPG
jgi:transposase